MIKAAQSQRDKVLWELANSTGKRGDLRRHMGMRYADPDPSLEELEKEGRIIQLTDKEILRER
jgi:hypothetical protein